VFTVDESMHVPYSCAQMFLLVSDIEAYPEFIAWCDHAHILSKNHQTVCAEIGFSLLGAHHTFATTNTYDEPNRITMVLHEGPFKHLDGVWSFQPTTSGHCQLDLTLSFDFSQRWLAATAGPFFQKAVSGMVAEFVLRADEVYGQ